MTEIIKPRKVFKKMGTKIVTSEKRVTSRESVIDPHQVFKDMIKEGLENHFKGKDFDHLVNGFYKIFPSPAHRVGESGKLELKEKKALHDFCNLYEEHEKEEYVKLVKLISNHEEMKSYLKEKSFLSFFQKIASLVKKI